MQVHKLHFPQRLACTQDQLGEPLFETISITLVCDDCMQTDHPEKYARSRVSCPFQNPSLPLTVPSLAAVRTSSPRCALPDPTSPATTFLTLLLPSQMPRWLSSAKMEVVKSLLR